MVKSNQGPIDMPERYFMKINLSKVRLFVGRHSMEAIKASVTYKELKKSISKDGLISPVVVKKALKGGYAVVNGRYRVLACMELGKKTVKAVVIKEKK